MNIAKKIVTLALVLALLLSVPIAPEVFAAETSTAVSREMTALSFPMTSFKLFSF